MPSSSVPLSVTLALVGLVSLGGGQAPTPVLAGREAGYREDSAGGRLVAWVHASLERAGGLVHLRIRLRAEGPGVDPVPGLEGVAGVNLRAAEELRRLLDHDGLGLETRTDRGRQAGSIAGLRLGRLPTRRIAPDGTLELDVATAAELPVEVTLQTGPLAEGRHHSYVVADGLPRLCVTTQLQGGRATVESIDSLGEDAARSPRRQP